MNLTGLFRLKESRTRTLTHGEADGVLDAAAVTQVRDVRFLQAVQHIGLKNEQKHRLREQSGGMY